jgi:hypothetical protein
MASVAGFSSSNRQLHDIRRSLEKAMRASPDVAETIMAERMPLARDLADAYRAAILAIKSSADGSRHVAALYEVELAALTAFLCAPNPQAAHEALASVSARGH